MLAAACRGKNNIDIIAIGTDSQMYHNLWDGTSWQRGWDSLGGSFASLSPSLVSWGQDHLEAFGIEEETSTLLRKTWNGDDWDDEWSKLEGPTFSSPVAVDSWGPDRIDVFGVSAPKDEIFHQTFSDSSWEKKWENIGGISIANPTVTSWSTQRLDIVVVGSDKSLWHRAWDFSIRDENNGWTEWETLNGSYLYSPAMVSWSANRLDIFAIDANSSMVFRAWEGDHWSPEWLSLGNYFISSPSLVSWGPGRLDVFALDKWHQMKHRASDDKWKGWQHDFSTIGTKKFLETPLAVSCGQGRLDVFAIEQGDGLVWHTSWNSSTGSESADGTAWGDWESIGRLSIKAASSQAASANGGTQAPVALPTGTSRATQTLSTTASTTTRVNKSAGHRIGGKNMLRFLITMAGIVIFVA